jgi:hypothetical protein
MAKKSNAANSGTAGVGETGGGEANPQSSGSGLFALHLISAASILALAIYVVLTPNVVYAPTPRIILYLLVSVMTGILFGSEATARLKLRAPGFVFFAAGAAALVCASLWLLVKYGKPEAQIAVFHVVDEQGNDVGLEWKGAVRILTAGGALTPTHFVDGNTLVLVFPEQVPEVDVQIRRVSGGPAYRGKVSYAGARTGELVLGTDLKLPKGNS